MPPLDGPAQIWTIIIPVKETAVAKTRLRGHSAQQRAALAVAFALDAATAAHDCGLVRRVVAVSNDDRARDRLEALGIDVLADVPDAGINPALSHAADQVRARDPRAALAAMSADLPALRGSVLTDAIERAGTASRWFVADRYGTGTTLLAARPGVDLDPQFGRHSAAAHRSSGAVALDGAGLDALRGDVDTEQDLRSAVILGVGRYTRAALTSMGMAVAGL